MAYEIGIVDGDAAVRRRLRLVLDGRDDRRVAFAVRTAAEALAFVATRPVSLIILDLSLPDLDGVELLRRLRAASPATPCLVFSALGDEQRLFAALRAGALGFLTKDGPPEAIGAAVEELRRGGSPLSPGVARRVVTAFAPSPTPAGAEEGATLTSREREILTFLAQGFTYQNAAARLALSTHTIHSHIRNIYRKLQVNSRSEAVYEALRRRLLNVA
jgi:DNA-binding NarL/FixJ family response regulator